MTTTEVRDWVEWRLQQAPLPSYRFPLAYTTWGADEILAALDCLCDQRTTMWEVTDAFEQQFAKYLGTTDAVMVNSGSSADLVMMMAACELGILQPGDEILIPAVTWPTQVWAAVQAGLNVRLLDVDPKTLNTTPELIESAITRKTRGLFLVHLMGNPCDMDAIQDIADRHGLWIFEDCCEALGAEYADKKVGTFGVASSFSFFQSHHITTMEGGMIATSDPDFRDACRLLRAHGWARDLKQSQDNIGDADPRYHFVGKGFNFRPTELSAAFGKVQLTRLPEMNRVRDDNAWRVMTALIPDTHPPVRVSSKARPAWFALAFILSQEMSRKSVTGKLHEWGVDTRPIVGGNLMRHPAFRKYPEMAPLPLPGADIVHNRGFYVGLPPKPYRINELIGLLRDAAE